MARPFTNQSGLNAAIYNELGHAMFAWGTTKPADGAVGYAKGCLFIDTDASAGSILFCNEGTHTSADFDAVSVA